MTLLLPNLRTRFICHGSSFITQKNIIGYKNNVQRIYKESIIKYTILFLFNLLLSVLRDQIFKSKKWLTYLSLSNWMQSFAFIRASRNHINKIEQHALNKFNKRKVHMSFHRELYLHLFKRNTYLESIYILNSDQ